MLVVISWRRRWVVEHIEHVNMYMHYALLQWAMLLAVQEAEREGWRGGWDPSTPSASMASLP